jgi:hypothetical protein
MRKSQAGRKGGRALLLKYGREHFREMSRLAQGVPRKTTPARYPCELHLSLSREQAVMVERIARMGKRSKGQVVRQALDWWLAHEWSELLTERPGKGEKQKDPPR